MIPFWKMHGIGNDFIVVEGFSPTPEIVRALCARGDGIGSDGLLLVQPRADDALELRMWNPDGSEAAMCGNGLRCGALWGDRFLGPRANRQILLAGKCYSVTRTEPCHYLVHMGAPSFDPADLSLQSPSPWIEEPVELCDDVLLATAVSMGNPHLVFFVDAAPRSYLHHGQHLETHPAFQNRTNVHFARVLNSTEIQMVTWERGAGPTLACGSGACAVAVAGWERNLLTGPQTLHLPGGSLTIAKDDHGVTMTGPAAFTFKGQIGL